MFKRTFLVASALAVSAMGHAQAPAIPYDNEAELAYATVTQISTQEAVAQRIMSWCDKVPGYDTNRVATVKAAWRQRNAETTTVNEALKATLRKLGDTPRAVIDEDVPQLAQAGAAMYTLAGELAAKRSPGGMVRLCDQTMAALDQGKFDLRNRLDTSVRAYVDKLASRK